MAPPVMPCQLIDSDREEEEQEWDEGGAGTAAEKLQVTTCLRRAFEDEEVRSFKDSKVCSFRWISPSDQMESLF